MFVTHVKDCAEFLAGDHTHLRELLHPAKAGVAVRYSLAYGRIDPGQRSKRHRLASAEVYYILAGAGRVWIDDDAAGIETGSVIGVPPGATQWVENHGAVALEFLCLVDPAWRPEDEEVME